MSLANGVAVPPTPRPSTRPIRPQTGAKGRNLDYPRWPDSKDLFLLDILPGREDNSFTSRLRRAVPTEGEGSAAPREAMDIQWSSGIQIPLSLEFQFPSSLPVTLFAGVVI